MTRQIFFCQLDGFDTHSLQVETQGPLLQQLSQSVLAFYRATQELGIDSMMGVEIVAAIERQYQIKIEDDEVAGFKDLDSAYALVVRKLEAKSATAAAE